MATLEVWPHPAQYEFLRSMDADSTTLFVGGLGSGKTLGGWIKAAMMPAGSGVGLVLTPTYSMVRDVLMATLTEHFRPLIDTVNKSENWVRFVNGNVALMRSATNADLMRGTNASWGWVDEACFVGSKAIKVWSGRVRVGDRIQWMTTTPIKGSHVYTTYVERGVPARIIQCRSDDNPYLSPAYIEEQRLVLSEKEARRELDAEWVDADGVLFNSDDIANRRRDNPPSNVRRVVIGVDPAVTSKRRSDRTGIIVTAQGSDGHAYVLEDLSGQYAPHEWAEVVCDLYDRWRDSGCIVVCETNQGGDLVERNLRAMGRPIAYRGVHAAKSKADRAQPIATHYRMGRVHHVGIHRELERQMTTWEPTDADSPDRLDALVWALTEMAPRDYSSETTKTYTPVKKSVRV